MGLGTPAPSSPLLCQRLALWVPWHLLTILRTAHVILFQRCARQQRELFLSTTFLRFRSRMVRHRFRLRWTQEHRSCSSRGVCRLRKQFQPFVPPAPSWGMQVTSKESARAALDLGADYLVCQGTEAGGHVQASRGLYEALPKVLEEAKQKPVIASGGIGNGEGIRKALLAGASAAMLGTRFVATIESNGHPVYKQAILAAHAQDTALTVCFQDGWPATHRALRNRTFVLWDAAGCPPPGKRPGEGESIATRPDGTKVLRYDWRSPFRGMEGAVTECALYAGLSVGFIKDLPAAGELVERLWQECIAAHNITGGTAPRFPKRSKNGRIRR